MREVQEFIEGLAADERIIVKRLRDLILAADPRIVEKLSYGVPYFSRNRRLFFLWPASALPFSTDRKQIAPKVAMGFCYGNLLSNDQGLLRQENRKQVYTISINTLVDINERLLREIVNEALIADAHFFSKK
jgi:uncharacterized protein YdhG (YjbR/CyaY superfamily)